MKKPTEVKARVKSSKVYQNKSVTMWSIDLSCGHTHRQRWKDDGWKPGKVMVCKVCTENAAKAYARLKRAEERNREKAEYDDANLARLLYYVDWKVRPTIKDVRESQSSPVVRKALNRCLIRQVRVPHLYFSNDSTKDVIHVEMTSIGYRSPFARDIWDAKQKAEAMDLEP